MRLGINEKSKGQENDPREHLRTLRLKRDILLGKPEKITGKASVQPIIGHWNNDSECVAKYINK